MFQWKRVHFVFAIYSLLISIGAFVTALYLFLIPSESIGNIFAGLSAQRLALIGSMLFAGILMLGLFVKACQDHVWAERTWSFVFKNEMSAKVILRGAIAGFVLSWLIVFTPVYRQGDLRGYFLRLTPLVVWFMFVCLLTFITGQIGRGLAWRQAISILRVQKKVWGIALALMIVFALTWLFISWTGIGMRIADDYWYGAGVPILGLQTALAFSIGIGLFFLWERSSNIRIPAWSDVLFFVLIWGVTAFFWSREPLPSSYFATGPDMPASQFYPFSDAATFDLGSQFALIGQGINNGWFFDRVLYMFFLMFLHGAVGQNYLQVVALQAAVYAVLPSILYLLGKNIHSRSFGLILAILAVLRGINGIAASSMIDLANQKQMLTDFPTAIFTAWFALMAVKWLQAPNKNYPYAIWVGGVTGLAVMLRTHALFLLVFALLLAVIVYWKQKIRGLLISVLLVAAMFATILPWGAYSGESAFDVFLVRINNVLEGRYRFGIPEPVDPQGNESNLFPAAFQTGESAGEAVKVDLMIAARGDSSLTAVMQVDDQSPPVYVIIASHFLHNLVMSVLIMPSSLMFHDLSNTLKVTTPFWLLYWDGSLKVGTGFFLAFNLFLIALGIGAAWRSNRLAGLVPLGALLFYNMANAFAQTSGGRYLVPVDWVVFFYYALGLLQLVLWGAAFFRVDADSEIEKKIEQSNELRQTPWTWQPLKQQAPWVMLVFLCVGFSMPLSDHLFPVKYSTRTQAELFTMMEQQGYLQEAGLDRATVDSLSAQWPAFRVTAGRALYPRYYPENKGEPKNRYPYGVLGFPRIGFTLIGPEGLNYVLLPEEQVPFFPNASDVFVLGCQETYYMDALVVVVVEENHVVYVRQPSSPLQCPLQQPVCDDNHVCR